MGSNPTPPKLYNLKKSVDNSIGFFLYRHRDHGVDGLDYKQPSLHTKYESKDDK